MERWQNILEFSLIFFLYFINEATICTPLNVSSTPLNVFSTSLILSATPLNYMEDGNLLLPISNPEGSLLAPQIPSPNAAGTYYVYSFMALPDSAWSVHAPDLTVSVHA